MRALKWQQRDLSDPLLTQNFNSPKIMAENLKKQPSKGILKNSSSFDINESQPGRKKSKGAKWDEMNIMQTLHPPGKDYGYMKIDEPKTPYNFEGLDDEEELDKLDAKELAERIRIAAASGPKVVPDEEEEDDPDDYADMTPEQVEEKKQFESKRKKHYNEFFAAKLARKLMAEDEEDDEEEEIESTPDNADETHVCSRKGGTEGLAGTSSAPHTTRSSRQ